MCDFHEPYFGARYPDACCIEGLLWDLDSCDTPGGPLTSGGDDPCPQCNHEAWAEGAQEHFEEKGYETREAGKPRATGHERIRFEMPGDSATFEAWWQAGWDMRAREEVGGFLAAGWDRARQRQSPGSTKHHACWTREQQANAFAQGMTVDAYLMQQLTAR